MSAAGGLFDEKVMDPGWDADWQAATRLGPQGWTVEIEIPFSSLGLTPALGNTWRIKWTMHRRGGQATLMVVHDCAYRAEDIAFDVAGLPNRHEIEVMAESRAIRSMGSRFTDRFAGYAVRLYRWLTPAE